MKCEICGEESAEVFAILAVKKPDGCLNTIACLECAKESSAYCCKHERPHLGFADDNTTACPLCIEEMVREKEAAEADVFKKFQNTLPTDEKIRLLNWAEDSASITGDTKGICTLRAIASKALRERKTFEEIIERIIADKSVDCILPMAY
jgi:hypothetical protein